MSLLCGALVCESAFFLSGLMIESRHSTLSPFVPDLICYETEPNPPPMAPARSDRDWMNETNERFAYRCIPMTIANATGWELLCPFDFEATWHGGANKADLTVRGLDEQAGVSRFVMSHFGHGILTFHPLRLFRTSPGWALWVRGAPNTHKNRIFPLEALVETDWLPFTFTMNWRFTRVGTVRFEKGEPFCFVTLVPHATMDQVEPRLRDLDDDPEFAADFRAWRDSRLSFNARLAELEPEAVRQKWQKLYVRGETGSDEAPGFHRSKRRMKPLRMK